MEFKKDISFRVYITFLVVMGMAVLVLGRVGYIQLAEGDVWRAMGDSTHIVERPIDAERGTIYSEDGYMLSASVPIFDVYVDFAAESLTEKKGELFFNYLDSISIGLSQLFSDRTFDEYRTEFLNAFKKKERYYLVKRKISYDQYKKLVKLPLVKMGKIKSGFIVETRDKRINPYVLLANRTIGLSRDNSRNNVGLELTYDSILRGKTGKQLMQLQAGTYIPVQGGELESQHGKNIITTIDTYIQDVTENALLNMMQSNNSLHGTCIVMETATGKIKAIANLGKQKDGTYTEDLNYGIGKRTEPGSVFKLATLIALLEEKKVNENTVINIEGGVKYFNKLLIKDVHRGKSEMTLKEAFARSSNVAFAKLADEAFKNKPSAFLKYLHKFRLDVPTGIDIIAKSGDPLIKKVKDPTWSATTIPFMAHGYEQLITPLQMLVLYNAVANNGKLMKPYLVNSTQEYGQDIQKFEPQVLEEAICSKETLKAVKACLLDVLEQPYGTAYDIKSNNYKICGKTGTAVTALDNKGYNKENKIYQSSFMGFFPANNPKYTIAVVIQNGMNSEKSYGSQVAAPVFKTVSDKIYSRFISELPIKKKLNDSSVNFYMIKKDDAFTLMRQLNLNLTKQGDAKNQVGVLQAKSNSLFVSTESYITGKKNSMPDVRGLTLKDALYYIELAGATVKVIGKGRVVQQSKIAGSEMSNGELITIELQ